MRFNKAVTKPCLSLKQFCGKIILQAGKNFIRSFLNRQTGQAVCFVFKINFRSRIPVPESLRFLKFTIIHIFFIELFFRVAYNPARKE